MAVVRLHSRDLSGRIQGREGGEDGCTVWRVFMCIGILFGLQYVHHDLSYSYHYFVMLMGMLFVNAYETGVECITILMTFLRLLLV